MQGVGGGGEGMNDSTCPVLIKLCLGCLTEAYSGIWSSNDETQHTLGRRLKLHVFATNIHHSSPHSRRTRFLLQFLLALALNHPTPGQTALQEPRVAHQTIEPKLDSEQPLRALRADDVAVGENNARVVVEEEEAGDGCEGPVDIA